MPPPSADSFAALARSSPWLWTTLRFTVEWRRTRVPQPVRAWLRRPDRLRVERLDGQLIQVVRESRRIDGPPAAGRRPDGLVALRSRDYGADDDPMYSNYYWVAMLDPLELADCIDPETEARVASLVVDTVSAAEHAGRPAWEAVVATTPAYEPRCSCCALLRSREVDVRASGAGGVNEVLAGYPEAFRVRLDVETGVCVLIEEIGGLTPGAGHDLRIEAVDEPMRDELFVESSVRAT